MKVYVAASSRDLDRAETIMDLCRAHKLEVTSTWVEKIRASGAANEGLTPQQQRDAAVGCIHEVLNADALLLVAPPPGVGIGAYVEMGAALTNSKLVVVAEGRDRSVFFAMADHQFSNVYEAVEKLALIAKRVAGTKVVL
jgi:hypothetical protein